jgi:hypothetical protein
MRYFGVLSSILLYILLLALVVCFETNFLNNRQSLWLNLSGMALTYISIHAFAIPCYKTKPNLIRRIFILVTAIMTSFSISFFSDFVEKTSKPPSLPKDDFSGVFIIPVCFVVLVLWGWIFDWRKNKSN